MNKGKIIILNGTSSSGKSSIAKSMLDTSSDIYYHIGIDTIASLVHEKHIAKTIDDVAGITHELAVLVMNRGINVILDTVFESNYPNWYKECMELFKGYDVTLANVSCELDELKNREQNRGDRQIGLAEYQTTHMHDIKNYNLEIDTTHQTPQECAKVILGYLERNDR